MEPSFSQKRVSARDIAKHLNVSHSTVSRALQGDPKISGNVRQKVQQTAQEMGYRPDPMLGALAHYRWSKTIKPIVAEIAWVNSWPDPKRLRSYKEFDLYWKGASEEAARNGFRLEEFDCPKKLPPSRLEAILLARNINGILLTPGWSGMTPDWNSFHWDKFSIVRFGHSLKSPAAHVVTSDQLIDGLLAFENMWKLGYRRIGMVVYRKQGTQLVRFSAGYLYAQLKMKSKERFSPLILNESDPGEDEHQFAAWLKRARPDAVLTDVKEVHSMLAKAGYRVPQDIGMAALSVLDGDCDAGISQNSEEIGKAAIQLLISLINHNERGIPKICRELLIEGCWIDGDTLPAKK